jgi:hypothetical protein
MRISVLLAELAMLLLAAANARAQQAWQPQFDALTVLLRGTWTMPTTKGLLSETWGQPNGYIVQGSSYSIHGTDILWLEHVML